MYCNFYAIILLMNKMKQLTEILLGKLRKTTYNQRGLLIVFTASLVVSGLIRYALVPVVTPDFTEFLQPWMHHMSQYGFAGLGNINSNYNTPYLVLLWLASFLPFSDLMSVKLISIFFDGVLAVGVFMIVSHFKPKGIVKYVGALAILFAPTVLQNGAMWGQCDVIYTSFIVFAFYAYLKKNIYLMWILWGVAFSFKLQAIFFAPFLVFATFYERRGFLGPIYAGLTIVLLSMWPLFFGKSIADVISIYGGNTAPIRMDFGLAWFSPTAYQWVTSTVNFLEVKRAGVFLGGIVAMGIIALAFVRRYSQRTLLVIATLSVLILPFFLPLIHERYLFTAEIFLIITACVVPRFIIPAIAMQIISTMAYVTYFTQANQPPPIAFPQLSIGVLIIIALLIHYVYKNSEKGEVESPIITELTK